MTLNQKNQAENDLILKKIREYASMAYIGRMTNNIPKNLKEENWEEIIRLIGKKDKTKEISPQTLDEVLKEQGIRFADLSLGENYPSFYMLKLDPKKCGEKETDGTRLRYNVGYTKNEDFIGIEPFEHMASNEQIHFFNIGQELFANESSIRRQFNKIIPSRIEDEIKKQEPSFNSNNMYLRFLRDKFQKAKELCKSSDEETIKKTFVDLCSEEYIKFGLIYRGGLSLKIQSLEQYEHVIKNQASEEFSFLILVADNQMYANAIRKYIHSLKEKGLDENSFIQLDKITLENKLR